MPQMAPMSWLILFMMFSLSLMLFTTMNYPHSPFADSTTSASKTMTSLSLFWKW
uniref:ATP synthase complex subunit 8 n=1 Tax=Pseudorhynchus acuminatus TaxID=1945536 RepID=A0A1Q1MPR6_9ORTH|nr:ATP synthase F0 subunit 8 [Pseudorhynchus acuminatus]AQM40073.1 ATP synthase F0 subunit 8 [Pseudorhynchus acuminatus]